MANRSLANDIISDIAEEDLDANIPSHMVLLLAVKAGAVNFVRGHLFSPNDSTLKLTPDRIFRLLYRSVKHLLREHLGVWYHENDRLGKLLEFFRSPGEFRCEANGLRIWAITQCYGLATALKHSIQNKPLFVDGQLVSHLHDATCDRNEIDMFGSNGNIGWNSTRLRAGGESESRDSGFAIGELSYSPPGIDGIFPKSDIWCLGCLYLDLVTWLILGPRGYHDFLQSRMDERGAWYIKTDQFFKVVETGSGGTHRVINDCVINVSHPQSQLC